MAIITAIAHIVLALVSGIYMVNAPTMKLTIVFALALTLYAFIALGLCIYQYRLDAKEFEESV